MLNHKFYKNLFSSICCFLAILFVDIILLSSFFANFNQGYSWVWLPISLVLTASYFLFGFYWIFQQVIFDEQGITIVLINKIIKSCKWTEVDSIELTNFNKNPAIKIMLLDGSKFYLDQRKSIIKAIEAYSQKKIGKETL